MTRSQDSFDPGRIELRPFAERTNLVRLDGVLALGDRPEPYENLELTAFADATADAVRRGAPVVMLMGAHVIKQGLGRYVADLLRRRWVSVLAMNGACAIHDYELARFGATSEPVAEYILDGRFGMWRETGEINDIVAHGARRGLGDRKSVV